MGYYKLANKVFLVEGTNTHAIYNFNNLKLYSINNASLKFIRNCISSFLDEKSLTQEDNTLLDFLSANFIIEKSNRVYPESNIKKYFNDQRFFNFAWVELTNLCNLYCKHCYAAQNFDQPGKMSFLSFKDLLNQLLDIGVKNIQIIGGEPLVIHNNLKKMLSLAVENFNNVSIYTNATLINHGWVKFFAKNNIKVNTTIFSYIASEHDKVTGILGSHKKTHSSIQSLKESGVRYSVSCVKMNGIEIGEKNTDLYDLTDRCDIVRLCGRASHNLLNPDLLKMKIITKKSFSKPLNPKICELLISGHNCFSKKLYITYDLKLYPCVMERNIEYGSLKQKKLKDLINDILPLSKNSIKVCKDCEYRFACFDCRPDRMSNDVFSKPWNCSYNPYDSTWQSEDDLIKSITKTTN